MASIAIHYSKKFEVEKMALGGKAYCRFEKDDLKAMMETEVYFDKGFSGIYSGGDGMMIFPSGKLNCPCCKEWKFFDMENPVVATCDRLGNPVYDGYICSQCADDFLVQDCDMQYGNLFHSENFKELKADAVRNASSKLVKQWRKHVAIKKERRAMVRSLSLVAKRTFEENGINHSVSPILKNVLDRYNTKHGLVAH